MDLDIGWRHLSRALQESDSPNALEAFEVLVALSDEPRAHSILSGVRGQANTIEQGARVYRSIREDRTNELVSAANDLDRNTREVAVYLASKALWWEQNLRTRRVCRDLLTASLEDEAWSVRRAAIRGLAQHADSSQMRVLFEMVDNTESREQLEVAIAIRYRMTSRNTD